MFGLTAGTLGYNLALSALICGCTNAAGFVITTITKTHKITDLIGCGTFALSAWATQIAAMHGNNLSVGSYHRPLFLTIATTLWSVRLAGFLFYRVLQTKTDKRFDGFYPKEGEGWLTGPSKYPVYLGMFWTAQALWAFTVLLPVTTAQAVAPTQAMGAWGWIGAAMFMGFWAYEAVADFQKDHFKRQAGNKDKFMCTGLYRYSQFPNYFAEISCWWALFFWAGFPSVFVKHPWIILSPVFTTLLLRFGSGVANLKPSQEARYGSRRDYQEYTASTPLLLPFMKPFYANRRPPAPALIAEDAGEEESPDKAEQRQQ